MIRVRALHDRVVIIPEDSSTITSGGIAIPRLNKENPQKGKVIATGRGIISSKGDIIPLDVKEGDVVLFKKDSGIEVKSGNKNIIVIREKDILAVLVESIS